MKQAYLLLVTLLLVGAAEAWPSGTSDQHGGFELRGIAPGDYKIFSWDEVESNAWQDPEFLKPYEDKGEKISVDAGDQKTINLKVIPTKNPGAKP